jgi:hypothetical protein
MPLGKTQQTSSVLYTLIAFVGLFIAATSLAIIFYVKAEGHRTKEATLQNQVNELATPAELREMPTLVGAKQQQQSRLGTMVNYLDETVSLIVGGIPEETSAEIKVATAHRQVNDVLKRLTEKHANIETADPNASGLVRIIEKLQTKLETATDQQLALEKQFQDLKNQFDDAVAINFEKEQTLLTEKQKFQEQINNITQDYNDLKALLEKTSQQQVQTLMAQMDQEKDARKGLNQKLLKTEAELKMAQQRLKAIQNEFQKLVPPPDSEVAAFKPDGNIILVDLQNKLVHLNLGSDDHLYRGLTFAVYEKNTPIPKDGKGKAEIEIFSVEKNFSTARIISSNPKKPIASDDIIANLIWDSSKTNTFVLAGDFDLNGDENIEYDAINKIKMLIEKWGGKVADTVAINTDFAILGKMPEVRKKPTFEETEADPAAMEKYETSVRELDRYKDVQNQVKVLGIPIFNYERFLYLIGYKTLSARPDAF